MRLPKGHALNLRWSKQGMPLPIPACETVDGAPFLIPPMRGRARIVLSPTGNRNALEKRRAAACNAGASPAPPCGPGHDDNADILGQHGLIHAAWLGEGRYFQVHHSGNEVRRGSAARLIVGESDDICLATECPVRKANRLL